jgi:integrase
MIDIRIKTPKGFKIHRDHKYGGVYCYHRKTGIKVDVGKFPLGSDIFYAECKRIASEQSALEPLPGTLGLLLREYERSSLFLSLKPRTQKDYRKFIDWLNERGRNVALHTISKPAVVRIRDDAEKFRSWDFANRIQTFLSTVFQWGSERGYIEGNPAKGIRKVRRPKDLADANPPLTQAEIGHMINHASKELREFIIVSLYGANRLGDTIRLLKTDYDGTYIAAKSRKTGTETNNPLTGYAKGVVDNITNNDSVTLLVNSYGLPWSESGIQTAYFRLREELVKQGLVRKEITVHSLRHTISTILAEAGVSEEIRAKICGHTPTMQRHYSKSARQQKLVDEALQKLDSIVTGGVELSKFRTESVKAQSED